MRVQSIVETLLSLRLCLLRSAVRLASPLRFFLFFLARAANGGIATKDLRSCLEIQTLRRTRSKKVARRETSGSSRASFRALKERKNFFPRLQRGKSIADLFQTFHVWLLSQCHFVAENNFQTVSKKLLGK
jgi:hypothetical protein